MDEQNQAPIEVIDADAVSAIPVSGVGQQLLIQTRPWVRFVSVLIFIAAFFMVLSGLVMVGMGLLGSMTSAGASFRAFPQGLIGVLFGLAYLVLSILYVPAGVFLFRYAGAIRLMESTRTSESLERALAQQRSFWRYVGIFLVVCAVVCFVASVLVGVLAALAAFQSSQRL